MASSQTSFLASVDNPTTIASDNNPANEIKKLALRRHRY